MTVYSELKPALDSIKEPELRKFFLNHEKLKRLETYPRMESADGTTFSIAGHTSDAFHLVEGREPEEPATTVLFQVETEEKVSAYVFSYLTSAQVTATNLVKFSSKVKEGSWDRVEAPVKLDSGVSLDDLKFQNDWNSLPWTHEANPKDNGLPLQTEASFSMRLGGEAPQGFSSRSWPHVKASTSNSLIPLRYLGQVVDSELGVLTVFVDAAIPNENSSLGDSFEPNTLNAVFVEKVAPEHVTMQALGEDVSAEDASWVPDESIITVEPLPGNPVWIQEEELGEGDRFVTQIESGVGGLDKIDFGGGGAAYVAVNDSSATATVTWQS